MILRFLFLFSFLSFTFPIIAQFSFEYNDSVTVIKSGVPIKNPWMGGLNQPQFSDFDYDFDGDLDLFVFDRSNNNIRVFTQEGTAPNKYYKLQPYAANFFPSDLRYRATMVDYDNDGRKDLFTYGIGGLRVFRNVGDVTNGLQWELFKEIVETQYPLGTSNLLVYSSDIPAIIDVDFDGDIDVLTFSQGGQHMEYHQNQSMEMYGIPDSLEFVLMNQCWGKFKEDLNTNALSLNDPNPPCVGGDIANPQKSGANHTGSTTLAIDIDNSGVYDLVIGDVSFNNLNLLINGGSAPNTDSPMISIDPAFPSNSTPVDVSIFPAAFFLDVDFDGVKDLIVAPNARNVSFNEKSVLFYKNLGSNALPNFVFVKNNFLQDEMIEHGTGTIPVFVDLNEDGLQDLIVANFYRYKAILDKESTLAYYQNTGTASTPVLTYIDDNYLNLSSANNGLRSIPTFGDLDGDGDQDMLLAIENGSLTYFENQSVGSGAVFGSGVPNYTDGSGQVINVGTFSAPQLFDVDDDGLIDLVLGKRTGELVFYRNTGTAATPAFTLTNSTLGGVDVTGTSGNPDGYAVPHFFRRNGETFLFVGNFDGTINHFKDIDGNLGTGQSFTLVSNQYLGINVEAYSACWVTDLDNDGNLDLYLGQDLGGIYRYEHDSSSTIGLHEYEAAIGLTLYPNPVSGTLTISTNDFLIKHLELISFAGGVIRAEEVNATSTELDLSDLPNGVYLIKSELITGQILYKRVVKH